MHNIIKMYCETNKNLFEILEEIGDADQPVEEILKILAPNNQEPSELLQNQIDFAFENGHPDVEVFSLFITNLIYYYFNNKMREKGESAYRISCAFDFSSYQPETQAYYFQACAFYFYQNNDLKNSDKFNFKSLTILSIKSPKYFEFLANAGQILSIDGRLALLPKEKIELIEEKIHVDQFCLRVLLRNSLFTVNLELIDKYIHEWTTRFNNQNINSREKIKIAIEVLRGNLEERPDQSLELNQYLLYYKSLKNGNIHAAKMCFKKISPVNFYSNLSKVFFFANFHHTFATGWYEIIENLINHREKQGYHYMLDFFVMRYFLVKKRKDLAKIYYNQLLINCEKFQAMGRLKFEMQFAFELGAISFFELTQPSLLDQVSNKNKLLENEMIATKEHGLDIKRIVGRSKAIVDIKKKIKQFADIQRSLLVVGETGVGKEEIARAIHEESKLKDKPFLAINCGTLSDTLLQSELFGYEVGAFTGAVNVRKGIFEEAEDGVVFLDEFGEMSPKLQVSLLRVLENNEIRRVGGTKVRKINCRIIAATNADIDDLIAKKLFREDLFHRLKQFSIVIPPLRERKEDIPHLIHFFLNHQNNDQIQEFTNELVEKFTAYHWPGNIRELKNEIDRIKIFCGNKPIIDETDVEIEWLNKKVKIPEKKTRTLIEATEDDALSIEEKMHQRITREKLSSASKRHQQIKLLFQQYKQLTRSQIAEALEISPLTAASDLKRLCNENFIIKKMPTKCPRSFYFEIISS